MADREERQSSIHDYFQIIYRRRWIALSAFFGVILSAAIYSWTVQPVYEAVTTVMFEVGSKRMPVLGFTGYMERQNIINNQVEILKSRTLAANVVGALRGSRGGEALAIMSSPDPVTAVMRGITVRSVRDTDIIEVEARAPTPDDAVLIANTVAQAYVDLNLQHLRGEITEIRGFLEEQLPKVQGNLRIAEETLRHYKQTQKVAALSEETKGLIEELTDVERVYFEIEAELMAAERRLASLNEQLTTQRGRLAEEIMTVSSPKIRELRGTLAELETSLSHYIIQGLSEDHPRMRELIEEIEQTKVELQEEMVTILAAGVGISDPLAFSQGLVEQTLRLEIEVAALRAKRDALKGPLDDFDRQLESLPEKEMELARLTRDFQVTDHIYRMLREKYEEARITEAGEIGNVRIIDEAARPTAPIRPRTRLNLILAALMGGVLGLGAAFVLEHLDVSVKSMAEVDRYLKLPILGSIPEIERQRRDGNEDRGSLTVGGMDERFIVHQGSKSPVSEAYRSLRTSLQFVNLDAPPRSLLVTSALPREGKSTIATNLGVAIAISGRKVILVESDLRRPVLHETFGVEKIPGITDVLLGEVDVSTAARPTGVENLYVLTSGSIPPNPSELLGSEKMRQLLEKLKQEFDAVILDSPPVLAVTDAVVLGSEVDSVILVVELGRTPRDAALRARQILQGARGNVCGVVVNMVPSDGFGYSYYHYYHYYRYYRYYDDDSGSDRRGRFVRRRSAKREPQEVGANPKV
ncbi:hypothetical protein AMJ39_00920 [candidate division TA06 bacterium DG_24]|uniref:non-specific protein-tyrosine kinase n=3 Tax=Bacteria division TA06 TaxID=1156500 RepID=A0A0S8JPF3_UNCT6|nr:MAG: hypothetical protein AMJ39_00920 [candidate division TA06 bacterium DG_24]KPK71675.1 MAG: hypothetical protein AMJ82_00245 [candidate division TA06 bacterium SM23_40]KPL11567.1 MAG: hypothetical protein AMJ71_00310 [candidate division TA06 bacterium SM1_40]